MNILRCVKLHPDAMHNTFNTEGTLIDFEYDSDEKGTLKSVDLRIHAIINNEVGKQMPINIVDKLILSRELLGYLEHEKSKEQTDNKDV